ncbi:hypothetical protein PSE10B_46310 [Pseudomonas amygdali pv. eriobotryae]|uniref:hypothetical protein n=1 Tax=Pseudomonas amygdali TaxID=47877 RepID=UPI001679A5DD|nr:hypothetical protein [Pseudomonas amygdali]GFZ68109.1 hypothetical protein PSE10B_46310 [Pseudomonas amygdali pv. eriobotryae]
MSTEKSSLQKFHAEQLDATLNRMEETLREWASGPKRYKSISSLATHLAKALGYDRSLFLAKPHPGKPLNHGRHRLVIDKWASQLVEGEQKISYELLEKQLKDTKKDLQMIEDAYRAGLRRKSLSSTPVNTPTVQSNFFYEFEQTCLVLQKVLNHPNTGLEIIEGELYDTAPLVGDRILISEVKACRPFVEWQSGTGTFSRKLLQPGGSE